MKKTLFIKSLFFGLIISQLGCAQDYVYLTPSKQFINLYYTGYHNFVLPKDAYNLERVLPQNPDKKGMIDYTNILQEAINKYPVLVMPDFLVLINAKGLLIPSNRKIYFNKHSVVVFKGPALGRLNDIIKIYNASNVKIYNANIVGSRKEKKEQKGEWSAGICILNSSNVEINNFQIKDTWGDGIFVGSENGKVSTNIILKNGFIDHARRNGISITSANNLQITSVFISNTYGTLPMAGIQIEPSLYDEEIKKVNLRNIYTFNNQIGVGLNLQSFSIKNKSQKVIDINIQNYTDDKANYTFITSINDDSSLLNPVGKFIITDAVLKNPKKDYYWRNSTKNDVEVIFKRIKKYKNNSLINSNE